MFPARKHARNCAVPSDEVRLIPPGSRVSRRGFGRIRLALSLALLLALPGGAQYALVQTSSQQVAGRQPGGLFSGMGDGDPIEEGRRLRALNAERQKSLVSDTNKLLTLARDLNDEVNRNNTGSLDQAQLTKVSEIEKLAHKIKEKMSTSVGTVPVYEPAYSPQFH